MLSVFCDAMIIQRPSRLSTTHVNIPVRRVTVQVGTSILIRRDPSETVSTIFFRIARPGSAPQERAHLNHIVGMFSIGS
jgi:hypothetical protein